MTWFPKNRVIVPVDFSDSSFAAIDVGLQLVNAPSDLTVVHVLQELSPIEPGQMWHTVDNESRTRNVTDAIVKRLPDDKYRGIRIEVLFGDAGHEITKLAEDRSADLIVLPSHGNTGLKRWLMGSVADRVIHLANCPVLVLKSP